MLFTRAIFRFALIGLSFILLYPSTTAWSAGHNDAPLIKQDLQTNITDLYAFIALVSDNACSNDAAYNQVFPYSSTLHEGPRNKKDSGIND